MMPHMMRRSAILAALLLGVGGHMQELRRAGYCITKEQINPGIAGISAPVFDDAKRIFGSLTLLGSLERFEAINPEALASLIQPAARAVSRALAQV